MVRFVVSLLIGAFLTAPVALAQDQEVPAIDPRAEEIAMNMANYLASQPRLSFDWFVSYDEIVEEVEKITYIHSGTMVLERDEGFVAQTEYGNTYRDFYFDGKIFTVASQNEDFYASMEITGGFETLGVIVRERADSVVPLWSLVSRELPGKIMDKVDGGAYLGTTLVAGQAVHHLSFSQPDYDWQIWVSMDEETPLPVMLIGTEHGKIGWPQYRAYFSDWNMEPDITEGQFTYQPEEGDIKMSFPAHSARAADNQSE